MGKVIQMQGWKSGRLKQIREQKARLPIPDGVNVINVMAEITDNLLLSERLVVSVYEGRLGTVALREQAVIASTNLLQKAHTLAASIGIKLCKNSEGVWCYGPV